MDHLTRTFKTAQKKALIKKWLKSNNRFDRLDGYTSKEINRLYRVVLRTVNT